METKQVPTEADEWKDMRVLQDYWQSNLEELQAQESHLDKYKQDLESIQNLLQQLPQQLKHKIMVPLSPVGFMPGYLKHTNEIMVSLGENYFVKRTANQAREIAERRLQYVQENMKSVQHSIDLLKARMNFQTQNEREGVSVNEEGFVEIREKYDSDDEKPQEVKEGPPLPQPEAPKEKKVKNPEDERDRFIQRLLELEREEELYSGLSSDEDEDFEYEDEDEEEDFEDYDDEDEELDEDSNRIMNPADILSHYYRSTTISTQRKQESKAEEPKETQKSPATKGVSFSSVLEKEGKKEGPVEAVSKPKSILKTKSQEKIETNIVEKDVVSESQPRKVAPVQEKQGFTGSVVERDTVAAPIVIEKPKTSQETVNTEQSQQRKPSLFKQMRKS